MKAELSELSEDDKLKASKFGYPQINIKLPNGKEHPVRVVQLNAIEAYGFYNQQEADEYSELLKKQIIEIKEQWDKLEDSWSKEEEL